jgi:hypothetical protein
MVARTRNVPEQNRNAHSSMPRSEAMNQTVRRNDNGIRPKLSCGGGCCRIRGRFRLNVRERGCILPPSVNSRSIAVKSNCSQKGLAVVSTQSLVFGSILLRRITS